MGLWKRIKRLESTLRETSRFALDHIYSVKSPAAIKGARAGVNYSASIEGGNSTLGRVYSARVHSVDDAYKGGFITVTCDLVFEEKPFDCKMASPFGGAGYGFFNVPGEGAQVLITEVVNEGWVWFACLQTLEVEPGGTATITQPKGKGDEAMKFEAEDHLAKRGREEGDPMQLTHGVPEGFLSYEENGQPEQYLWKTPKGHKIIMSEKHTEEHEEKHITIKSLGGKMILLDDADPRTDIGTEPSVPAGATGDRIIISDGDEWEDDGGPNRIWIQSTAGEDAVEDSIQVYARNALFLEAKEGNINISVLDSEAEDAHILITNLAKGNLEIDIEEGDIAAVARYRICLNAWNEDESVDPETGIPKILGSVGIRSKGMFSVRNGMGSVSQNIQMSHKKGWGTMNSGKQGLALFGQPGGVVTGPVKRAHLMGTEVYITAKDHIHLEATKITMNGKTIALSDNVSMPTRDFEEIFNNPIPDSLSPCRDIEADTGFSSQIGGEGDGGQQNPNSGGGVGVYDPFFTETLEGTSGGDDDASSDDDEGYEEPPPTVPGGESTPGSATGPDEEEGGDNNNQPGVPPDQPSTEPKTPANPTTPSTPTPSDPYSPSTPGAMPSKPMVPNTPNPPGQPPKKKKLQTPTTGGKPHSVPTIPNTPSGPWEDPLLVTYYENHPENHPFEDVRFTDGPSVGGGGGDGGGGGGGGPSIDDDMFLGNVGNFGGGGEGGEGGPTFTYESVDVPDAGDAKENQRFSSNTYGLTSQDNYSIKASWFQETARNYDVISSSSDSVSTPRDTTQSLVRTPNSIEPAPTVRQALPGQSSTSNQDGTTNTTPGPSTEFDSTQYYLPPGGGGRDDIGGIS